MELLHLFNDYFICLLRCKISGWGAKKEGGDASQFLEAADVDIIDRTVCNQDNWLMGLVLGSMLCAGTEDGSRDACQVFF